MKQKLKNWYNALKKNLSEWLPQDDQVSTTDDHKHLSVKPTAAQSTTEKPIIVKPTATPTAAQPTTAKPIAAVKSTTEKPITVKPTATPTTAKPTTAKPTTAKPIAAVKSTTEKPIIVKPTATPTAAQPITAAQSTTEKPITVKPTATPTTAKPIAAVKSTTEKPITVKPTATPTATKPITAAQYTTDKSTTDVPSAAEPTATVKPDAKSQSRTQKPDKKQGLFEKFPWAEQMFRASGGKVSATLSSTFFVNILSLAFPMMMLQVYDRIIPNRSFSTMYLLFAGVSVALLIELILRVMRASINLWSDTKYEYTLGKKAFRHVLRAPLPMYEQAGAGSRLRQLGTLNQMRGFYNTQLLASVFDVPFVIIFLIVVAYLGGWLVIVPMIMVVVMVLVATYKLKQWEPVAVAKIAQAEKETNFLVGVLNNIHTVKALDMEAQLLRRYERLQASGEVINYRSSVQVGDLSTIRTVFSLLVMILLVAFGGIKVINGSMTIGGLAACTLLSGRIMQPLNRVLSALNRWQTINIAKQDLDEILNLPVKDEHNLADFGSMKGEITFDNVSFRYEADQRWILKDVNITFPARETLAILGQGQCGKTTLANLIAGILTPTKGRILIDGKDISQYRSKGIKEQIAYLAQSGDLFNGSIMDNLSAFNDELIPSARRIAKALGLNEIIAKLPKGFDTPVSDKSAENLPQGVSQRIVLTRALVHKPKLVIFDEANINLDFVSDTHLHKVLSQLKKIATIIIISHRPSILQLATESYVLENGSIKKVPHVKKQQ